MKNAIFFDRLISRLIRAKERINKFEDMSVETLKLKCKEKQEWKTKKKEEEPRTEGQFPKFNTHINGILEREKREWSKKNIWRHNSSQFYTINDKYQITNPGS